MEDSNYDWLEYEEEQEQGPVGPRALLDFCQGGECTSLVMSTIKQQLTHPKSHCIVLYGDTAVVMRYASRYDDVGPLRYHQHPLFFQTMEPLQLAQIEDNSPVSLSSYHSLPNLSSS
jgi:hypothetical protein